MDASRQVRIEVRKGSVDAPRGEDPTVTLDLAYGEDIVAFEARPNVQAFAALVAGQPTVTWRWKAYVAYEWVSA